MTDAIEGQRPASRADRTDIGTADPPAGAEAGSSAPGAVPAVAAALSGAAGAIHLAMVPSHMGEDATLAVSFAVAGWVQLATAVALLVRPTRLVVAITAAANLGFIGAWVLSRTAGLPFGPHAGQPEASSFVDLTALGLEIGVTVLCGVLLARPAVAGNRSRPALLGAAAAAVAVAVLGTVALTSTSASGHASDMHAEHGSADSGHAHGDEAGAAGEAASGVYGGDHPHEASTVEPLDMATQAQLSAELELARAATILYPTVADVKAAGGVQLNKFTPGSGAHYTMPVPGVPVPKGGFNLQAIMGNVKGFDAANPPIVLYSGNEDTSVVVGLMYVVFDEAEPEGFVGGSDIWHRHQGVCAEVKEDGGLNILLPIEIDTTKEQCDAVGGNHMPVTPWMVHVWTAAGWESPQGVFSHENPLLVCSDGTLLDEAYDFSKGCAGLG